MIWLTGVLEMEQLLARADPWPDPVVNHLSRDSNSLAIRKGQRPPAH